MKKLKNKKISKVIISAIIITIITITLIVITGYEQYKTMSNKMNKKIAIIIAEVMEKYPEVDSKEIVKILSYDNDDEKLKKGQEELMKYGIDVNEINSIISIQNQIKKSIGLDIILIILFNILWGITAYLYLKQRDKKINQITKYINEIKNKNYELDIAENSEDELSNLKNELYKITVMLKEESEISRVDKENIKKSVEDISHQLKTPLTSITIMLYNLKNNPNMEENTKQKFIFEISKQIDWINWLVISLLKLSKLDANVVEFINEKINVKMLINDIVKSLEIPIEIKNQNIIIQGDEATSFIGDYKWQKEAITNIIKNCIEHNKETGKIYIKYEENTLFTRISIKDEGEGISKEDIKHIFERFYKGKNSSENSIGIGLALAKNIIQKNNGMISCKSEPKNGTEFIIKYMK